MGLRVVVTSFNIRTAAAPDGAQGWDFRKHRVVERIRAADPDLLGLQECREDAQGDFLRRQLPDYEFIGVPRGGAGDSALEMAPLMFRRERFKELGRGHFWLSSAPGVVGSQSWGADFPRTASWVRLRPHQGGAPLVFLNTHFDYAGTSREEAAKLLHRWAAVQSEAVVITGDFNAERGSLTHRILTDDGLLRDGGALAGVTDGSFQDFGKVTPEALDWILISPRVAVVRAEVDRWRDGALYPSDHFPVTVELVLPG